MTNGRRERGLLIRPTAVAALATAPPTSTLGRSNLGISISDRSMVGRSIFVRSGAVRVGIGISSVRTATVRATREQPGAASAADPRNGVTDRPTSGPERARRDAQEPLEPAGQVRLVAEADLRGHVHQRGTLEDPLTRRLEPAPEDVGVRRDPECTS